MGREREVFRLNLLETDIKLKITKSIFVEDRSEEGVKSEISEESGYHSVKTEEEGLNLSTHASSNNSLSGSAPSYHLLAHGEGSSSRYLSSLVRFITMKQTSNRQPTT